MLIFVCHRYAITDMRKLANRMQFGVPEESSLGKFPLFSILGICVVFIRFFLCSS